MPQFSPGVEKVKSSVGHVQGVIVSFPYIATFISPALLPRLYPGSVVFTEDPHNPRAILHTLGKG